VSLVNIVNARVSRESFSKRVVWSFLGLVLAATAPGEPPAESRHYRLVFSDEFDLLDLGTGEDGLYNKPHNWYEGIWFSKHHAPRESFVIADSTLSLTWKRGQTEPDSSIATFSRHNRHYNAWRYGYFEARMKWQPQEGAWPALWLIPVQPATEDGPRESGEIDIFEGQGSEPHTFFGTIHRWNGSQQLASSSPHNHFPLPPKTDFSQFHTYGLLWVPGRVTWYFDGVALHSEATYEIFDRQDYFLILGMQEGRDWEEGNLAGVSAQSLTLTVDWVRVWQP
jgi:beta-glucanase (GH16 family)